ncbi:MAG: hypothetical protein LBN10_10610 [Propionibacteriaceae bacterium]|jgi:hypothetical protein|nr:hypothetical protein [Propionibacteriaceae bacterium]
MNRTSKKSLYWAIPLIVAGIVIGAFTPTFMGPRMTPPTGNPPAMPLAFLGQATSALGFAAVAVGAALLAAAIIISALKKD